MGELKAISSAYRIAATIVVAAAAMLAGTGPVSGADNATAATPDNTNPAEPYLYIPPAIAPRVVFYHSFSQGLRSPEINLIDASVKGKDTPPVPGFTGNGYKCPQWKPDKNPLIVESNGLDVHRPITVMLWWRLDKPMIETTGFNVLTLRGKGIIGTFVRGKGTWCALPEPRRIFQVYYFPGIANRNDPWGERVWITDNAWCHTAITVAAATDVRVYWDGELKTHYAIKGRPFQPGDITHAVFGTQHGAHPMTVDELLVLDCVLDDSQIRDYVTAVQALAEVNMPFVIPGQENATAPKPAKE